MDRGKKSRGSGHQKVENLMATAIKSLTARCNEFFGRHPGQSMSQFAAELKQLTPEDRQWFVNEFNKNGMPCEDTTAAVKPS